MNDDTIRRKIRAALIESGVVVEEQNHISHFDNGREYLILVTVVDVTDMQHGRDSE